MAYRGFFIGGNFFGEERAKTKNQNEKPLDHQQTTHL
jgi:hypothetical protein